MGPQSARKKTRTDIRDTKSSGQKWPKKMRMEVAKAGRTPNGQRVAEMREGNRKCNDHHKEVSKGNLFDSSKHSRKSPRRDVITR